MEQAAPFYLHSNSTQDGEAFSTLLLPAIESDPNHAKYPAPTLTNPNPSNPCTAKEADTAPPALRRRVYVAFRLRRDGSTNLPAQNNAGTALHWCLSLRALNVPAPADK